MIGSGQIFTLDEELGDSKADYYAENKPSASEDCDAGG